MYPTVGENKSKTIIRSRLNTPPQYRSQFHPILKVKGQQWMLSFTLETWKMTLLSQSDYLYLFRMSWLFLVPWGLFSLQTCRLTPVGFVFLENESFRNWLSANPSAYGRECWTFSSYKGFQRLPFAWRKVCKTKYFAHSKLLNSAFVSCIILINMSLQFYFTFHYYLSTIIYCRRSPEWIQGGWLLKPCSWHENTKTYLSFSRFVWKSPRKALR